MNVFVLFVTLFFMSFLYYCIGNITAFISFFHMSLILVLYDGKMWRREYYFGRKETTDMTEIRVNMLGEFSIEANGVRINDSDNRSRKIWLLLAYMIYFRNSAISQDRYVSVIWGE